MSQCLDERIATAATSGAAAERARKHYDRLALLYRLFWGEHLHHGLFRSGMERPLAAQLEMVRHCISLVQVRPNWEVLDVGCGYGATAIYLAKHYRCLCTGLTISAAQAAYARKRSRGAGTDNLVHFLVCNAEAQPLDWHTYDLIWVMEASEHFADRAAFFRRVIQALRRDGFLLLTCWAARAQTPQLQRLAQLCSCPDFQTIDTYVAQISDAGLRIDHLEELTAVVAVTWDIVQRRTASLMPTLRLWPNPIRQFASAIGELRQAFHWRDLQYWVVVAHK